MTEIMGHPWVTYTSFPKYIDYKLMKIQNLATRRSKETINHAILSNVLEKPFNRKDFPLFTDVEKAVRDRDLNRSFVVGYNLCHYEDKKLHRGKHKENAKSKENGFHFTFGLLEHIFEYKETSEKFKKLFRRYTIDLFKDYERIPWRVGLNYCTNIKKLIRTFLKAASLESIRVEIVNPVDYKFRCVIVNENRDDTPDSFFMQIFDDSDEFVIDFLNEKAHKITFLLVCFKLSRRMKV